MLQSLLVAAADPTDHVVAHRWFGFGDWFVFTNQMFMALLAAGLLLLILPRLFKDARGDAPTGARNAFEAILEFLRPGLKEHTDRFVPLLWSLFFFILFCNLLGQIPVDEIIHVVTGGKVQSHIWGTATGTPLTTGALAVLVFFVIHVAGVQQVARSLMDGTYGQHGHHEE